METIVSEMSLPKIGGAEESNGAVQAAELVEVSSLVHVPSRHEQLVQASKVILENVDAEPEREGLVRTPERMARALMDLTQGAQTSVQEVINGAVFAESYDEMVLVKDIEFYSLCEHHLLPFYGRAHIAYLPAGHVIGLSKLPRILEVFARRLQVQERLTQQVAEALSGVLQPRGVAVVLEAAHFCMMMRGIQKQNSKTVTSTLLGEFRSSPELRSEFLSSVRGTVG